MNIDNTLNEASKEITGLYTIIIKDGNKSRRYTFQSHKIGSLKKELSKNYGSKVITKIASAIRKAETKGTLKLFAKDDSVDFEITGDKVKALFKEDVEISEKKEEKSYPYSRVMVMTPRGKKKLVQEFGSTKEARVFMKEKNSKMKRKGKKQKYFLENTLGEANIEIKDKNASIITVNGKPYKGNLGSLKADYPKHFAALKKKLKNDGKTLANLGGNDPKVDIVAKADGTIVINYDA